MNFKYLLVILLIAAFFLPENEVQCQGRRRFVVSSTNQRNKRSVEISADNEGGDSFEHMAGSDLRKKLNR